MFLLEKNLGAVFSRSIIFLIISTIYSSIKAQNSSFYQPTHQEILLSYKSGGILDSLGKNSVFKSSVSANWKNDNTGFWYRNSLPGNNAEYMYVNAKAGNKQKAF